MDAADTGSMVFIFVGDCLETPRKVISEEWISNYRGRSLTSTYWIDNELQNQSKVKKYDYNLILMNTLLY
jgi:hypothetical protein